MKKRKKRKRPASKEFVWKNYTRPIVLLTVIILIFSAILLLVYDPLIAGKEVSGSVQSEYKETLQQYVSICFVIKLDNGQLVDVQANRMGAFKKGKRVILQEMTGLIFKRKEYRFLRYSEQ